MAKKRTNKQDTTNHTPPRSMRIEDEIWEGWREMANGRKLTITDWMIQLGEEEKRRIARRTRKDQQ